MNATSTYFWHDKWCSNSPLHIEAPCIYAITSCKEAKVADRWNPHEVGGLNVLLRRNLNIWEVNEMSFPLGLVDSIHPKDDTDDLRRWTLTKNGKFLVSSCGNHSGILKPPPLFGRGYGV